MHWNGTKAIFRLVFFWKKAKEASGIKNIQASKMSAPAWTTSSITVVALEA